MHLAYARQALCPKEPRHPLSCHARTLRERNDLRPVRRLHRHAGEPRARHQRRARLDYSAFFRQAFETSRLTDAQAAALKWLVAQPNGPRKSSSSPRTGPLTAAATCRPSRASPPTWGWSCASSTATGKAFSSANVPSLADAPDSNADIMAEFLNHKNGQTWQSIPVCVFFTRDLEYLYHFTEYPAIYDKDRVVTQNIRAPRPGESPEQTRVRVDREFGALQKSPFFRVWASATVDEIISAPPQGRAGRRLGRSTGAGHDGCHAATIRNSRPGSHARARRARPACGIWRTGAPTSFASSRPADQKTRRHAARLRLSESASQQARDSSGFEGGRRSRGVHAPGRDRRRRRRKHASGREAAAAGCLG